MRRMKVFDGSPEGQTLCRKRTKPYLRIVPDDRKNKEVSSLAIER